MFTYSLTEKALHDSAFSERPVNANARFTGAGSHYQSTWAVFTGVKSCCTRVSKMTPESTGRPHGREHRKCASTHRTKVIIQTHKHSRLTALKWSVERSK